MGTFNLTDIDKIIALLRRRLRLLEIQGGRAGVQTGLAVNRPTVPDDLPTGVTITYYAYDTKVFSIWNIDTETWNTVTLS